MKPVTIIVAAIAAVVLYSPTAHAARTQPTLTPDGTPIVYLTFDDGPNHNTTTILDVLHHHNIPATFFVLGQAATHHPHIIDRIVAEHHGLGNHTWNHQGLNGTYRDAYNQLAPTQTVIHDLTGYTMTCYRPPYGQNYNQPGVHQAAHTLGLTNQHWSTPYGGTENHWGLWTIDTNDYKRNHHQTIWHLNQAAGGDVILLHDIRPTTTTTLREWLAANRHRYEFRALPGCTPNPRATGTNACPATTTPINDLNTGHRATIGRLYQTVFNRAPDPNGWNYWTIQCEQGTTIDQITRQFITSAEWHHRYGTATSDTGLVELLYRNVLNRAPDPAGRRYWTDLLTQHKIDPISLIRHFSDSEEHQHTWTGT